VFVWEHSPFEDAKKVVDILVRSHANAIRFPAITQHGNLTFYNSKIFPKHPGLGERDLLQELTDECRKHDIHMFPYNSLGYSIHPLIYRKHPDWALRRSDGTFLNIRSKWPSWVGIVVCLNNPGYAETYSKACKEIVSNYDVSGMYFDGPYWGPPEPCFCIHCKKAFFDKYGFEIPNNLVAENDSLRKYILAVRSRGYEYLMSKIVKQIKSTRDIPIVYNQAINTVDRYKVIELVDGAMVAELKRPIVPEIVDQSNYMDSLMSIKAGVSFGKATWCYFPIGPFNDFVTYNTPETMLFGLTELAHGATPIAETLYSYLHDETGLPAIKELFTHMEKNEELYFQYKPVPFIALPFSRQNVLNPVPKDFIWRDSDFYNHIEGAFKALSHTHKQFNIIFDEDININSLKKYAALYLANVACLSDDQIDAIKTFVMEGGGLIATYQTSLFDKEGYQREDFGLKDLFKASYKHIEDPKMVGVMGPPVYLHLSKKHSVIEDNAKGKLIPYQFTPQKPIIVCSVLKGGEVISNIYLVSDDKTWSHFEECFKPPISLKRGPPGIIASKYEKGRVVYIAPALDALYRARGFRIVRKLISNAVDWVTKNENPYKTSAPNCVITNLTEKGDTRALHLINYTGNMHENPAYKVEWVAPLNNILINARNPAGKKLSKVKLLTANKEISFKRKGNYATIKLPKLDTYECIKLKYI
jgi:hypothetical protein